MCQCTFHRLHCHAGTGPNILFCFDFDSIKYTHRRFALLYVRRRYFRAQTVSRTPSASITVFWSNWRIQPRATKSLPFLCGGISEFVQFLVTFHSSNQLNYQPNLSELFKRLPGRVQELGVIEDQGTTSSQECKQAGRSASFKLADNYSHSLPAYFTQTKIDYNNIFF